MALKAAEYLYLIISVAKSRQILDFFWTMRRILDTDLSKLRSLSSLLNVKVDQAWL